MQLLGDQEAKLRCLACGSALELTFLSEHAGYPDLGPDGTLSCSGRAEDYSVIAGTPRMLTTEHHERLHSSYPLAAETLSRHRHGNCFVVVGRVVRIGVLGQRAWCLPVLCGVPPVLWTS